jgi:hypothetical protein
LLIFKLVLVVFVVRNFEAVPTSGRREKAERFIIVSLLKMLGPAIFTYFSAGIEIPDERGKVTSTAQETAHLEQT